MVTAMTSAMNSPRLPETNRLVAIAVCILVTLAVGVTLFFFNPATTWFLPSCTFHRLTGLYCPGCGSTRALHCLLHGEFREALRDNALVVLALPITAAILLARIAGLRRSPVRLRTRIWFAFLVAVLVGFGVLRNIPVPPFSCLAPGSESDRK